ncbi:MAG: L,D-transpeptidase family protein [Kordiimonadaceae bacterium]|nr:L,D-transpeptidase family protein [Kordiimonadaceae bacterium]
MTPDHKGATRGRLLGPDFEASCALGKAGTIDAALKAETDGCTPLGEYAFRRVYYRADKGAEPTCGLPCSALSVKDGWCDAADHPHYNQHVCLPFAASHEKLWRADDIYDFILVIGHNDAPVEPGKGSAIFMHVAREGYTPTLGCVALSKADMLDFLATLKADETVEFKQ